MEILSPKNYQVFQRYCKNKGYIAFKGINKSPVTIKITGKDFQNNPVEIEENIIVTDDFNIEVPAGGWYKTEIKTDTDIYIIDHVGVGEIIVGAGQSNSTNSGQFRIETETNMVATTDGIEWRIANDPMLGTHDMASGADGCGGGSFYPALGDALYKEFNVPIGIASCGYGATSVLQWLPDAVPVKWDNQLLKIVETDDDINLFDYLINRMNQLGLHGFRCLVWHQGETDHDLPEYKYYSALYKVITACQKSAGWYVPWFVAIASYIITDWDNPNPKKYYNVREAQKRICTDKIAHLGPDTDTLGAEYRDETGVHFGINGLKTHGKMWADCIIPYIHSLIDL